MKTLFWIFAGIFMVSEVLGDGRIIEIGETPPGCKRIKDNDTKTMAGSKFEKDKMSGSRAKTIEETFKKPKINWDELYEKARREDREARSREAKK